MTGGLPPVRRRDLTGLLAVSSGVLLATACTRGPSQVPTSSDVPHDPLARLKTANWDARTAPEILARPLQVPADDLAAWADLGADDAFVEPARRMLVGFLEAAYLSPEAQRGLDDAAVYERIEEAAPEYWRDDLLVAWDDGERHFYAFCLAEPFRTVGRPAIAADWFRAEQDGAPVLLLGGTIAWTVLDTQRHAVGVIAYRFGIIAAIDTDGTASSASIRVTVHGLDGCSIPDSEGLVVPALGNGPEHVAAQEATMDTIIASPRFEREILLDVESAVLAGDDVTNVFCE